MSIRLITPFNLKTLQKTLLLDSLNRGQREGKRRDLWRQRSEEKGIGRYSDETRWRGVLTRICFQSKVGSFSTCHINYEYAVLTVVLDIGLRLCNSERTRNQWMLTRVAFMNRPLRNRSVFAFEKQCGCITACPRLRRFKFPMADFPVCSRWPHFFQSMFDS